MIEPPSAMTCPACLSTRNVPVRHTSIVVCQPRSSRSVSAPGTESPAQLTTMSSGPAVAKPAATDASSVTSTCSAWAPNSSPTVRAAASLTSAITTSTPSACKARAVASPMPDAPPMISARRPTVMRGA